MHGQVPLLLSRKALSTLGMFYDVEGHKADFRRSGLCDFPLLTTENGHPAIPVKPQHSPRPVSGRETKLDLS